MNAVAEAIAVAGLDVTGLRALSRHSTDIYLLPREQIIARVTGTDRFQRQRTALTMTRWLVDRGVAVTEPTTVDIPITTARHVVTFWRYYPQPGIERPPAQHLGILLRQLHQTDVVDAPIELPTYQPLERLGPALTNSRTLSQEDRIWLRERRAELLDAYARFTSHLGVGLIHGDAYPANTLWDTATGSVRLGDWDEVAVGPRELDLANTLHGGRRFGRRRDECVAFLNAYGYDPAHAWRSLELLIDIRDLHSLGTFIRRSDRGDHNAARQLDHRIATLRTNATTPWTAAH
ncbi:phosphotransferase [Spiractinospora alimapuensis]|uniref:phosphotransferase n=1 Tax=Spiractinospora alimapuensis TaxID=2820884 RepID=UPI001F39CE04|nr:phosphotransferase [Spiractinospora alimapuensis]QVQ53379.1 phosphotransferase [Spiractinospora alimapuensis]